MGQSKKIKFLLLSPLILAPPLVIASCSNGGLDLEKYLNDQINLIDVEQIPPKWIEDKWSNSINDLDSLIKINSSIGELDANNLIIQDEYKYTYGIDSSSVSIKITLSHKQNPEIKKSIEWSVDGFDGVDEATKNMINGAYEDFQNNVSINENAIKIEDTKPSLIKIGDINGIPDLSKSSYSSQKNLKANDNIGSLEINFLLTRGEEKFYPFLEDDKAIVNKTSKTITGFLNNEDYQIQVVDEIFKTLFLEDTSQYEKNMIKTWTLNEQTLTNLPDIQNKYYPSSIRNYDELSDFYKNLEFADLEKEQNKLPFLKDTFWKNSRQKVKGIDLKKENLILDFNCNDEDGYINLNIKYKINNQSYQFSSSNYLKINFPSLQQNKIKAKEEVSAFNKAYEYFTTSTNNNESINIKYDGTEKDKYPTKTNFNNSPLISGLNLLDFINGYTGYTETNRFPIKVEKQYETPPKTPRESVIYWFSPTFEKIDGTENDYKGYFDAKIKLIFLGEGDENGPTNPKKEIPVNPSNEYPNSEGGINYGAVKNVNPIKIFGFKSKDDEEIMQLLTEIKTNLKEKNELKETNNNQFWNINNDENGFVKYWEENNHILEALQALPDAVNFPDSLELKFYTITKPVLKPAPDNSFSWEAKIKFKLVSTENDEIIFELDEEDNQFPLKITLDVLISNIW